MICDSVSTHSNRIRIQEGNLYCLKLHARHHDPLNRTWLMLIDKDRASGLSGVLCSRRKTWWMDAVSRTLQKAVKITLRFTCCQWGCHEGVKADVNHPIPDANAAKIKVSDLAMRYRSSAWKLPKLAPLLIDQTNVNHGRPLKSP